MADIWKLHFGGFLAWLIWLFVHIFFLIGFRNRVLVLIQWAWSYFTYSRGARLITEEPDAPSHGAAAGRDAGPPVVITRRRAQGARAEGSASSPAASPTRARRPTPTGSIAWLAQRLCRHHALPPPPGRKRRKDPRINVPEALAVVVVLRELLLAGLPRRISSRPGSRKYARGADYHG